MVRQQELVHTIVIFLQWYAAHDPWLSHQVGYLTLLEILHRDPVPIWWQGSTWSSSLLFDNRHPKNIDDECKLPTLFFFLQVEWKDRINGFRWLKKYVKYVIENSARIITDNVTIPGTDELIPFNELSKSGGLLNAYSALQLASTLKGERNIINENLPKPIIKKSKKQ